MAKTKKMLAKDKKALLDKLLKWQEDDDKLRAAYKRLDKREDLLRERELKTAQALASGMYANGEDASKPILYKGRTIKVNMNGAVIESVKRVR